MIQKVDINQSMVWNHFSLEQKTRSNTRLNENKVVINNHSGTLNHVCTKGSKRAQQKKIKRKILQQILNLFLGKTCI